MFSNLVENFVLFLVEEICLVYCNWFFFFGFNLFVGEIEAERILTFIVLCTVFLRRYSSLLCFTIFPSHFT